MSVVSSMLSVARSAPVSVWSLVNDCTWKMPSTVNGQYVKCGAVCAVAAVVGTASYLYILNPKALVKSIIWLNRHRVGFETKCVRAIDGFTFSYAERGRRQRRGQQTTPTMVLVGGVGGTVENWVPIVKHMSRDIHVIVVEMPASGVTSCDPTCDLHILGQVERLKQFLRLTRLDERPVDLVGAATGGTIVGCFAAVYPELVNKLVLICPAMRSPIDSDMIKMKKSGVEPGLIPQSADAIPVSLQLLTRNPKNLPKQILVGLFELKRPSVGHLLKFLDSMFEDIWLNDEDTLLTPRLRQITAPTLVVWGQFDRVIHVSGADVLRDNLVDCVGIEILDSGHSVYMDQPQTVATLLQNFARSVVHSNRHDVPRFYSAVEIMDR